MIAATPIWIAAKIVGAGKPTLLRSIFAVFLGAAFSFVTLMVAGGFGLLLAPIAFLFAFKILLDTSMFGAIILSVIAAAINAAIFHLMSSGINVSN